MLSANNEFNIASNSDQTKQNSDEKFVLHCQTKKPNIDMFVKTGLVKIDVTDHGRKLY